jgi:xanthine dehydrogenase accessory factor
MSLELYEEIARLLRSGRTVAVATLVRSQGSTPRRSGTKMIVVDDGTARFSIGGGAFEAMVIEDARAAIRAGRGCEKEYRFKETGEGALGMVCGGSARVLFEVVAPPAALMVFGAGHVGREVVHLAVRLGFETTVADDRPAWLDAARFPEGTRLVLVGHDYAEGMPALRPASCVAILTRCHRTDLAVLRHVAGGDPAYVGLIGSRRKAATIRSRALDQGVPAAILERLHAPIGLPIGAETPAEIAVSIMAEIVRERSALAEERAAEGRAAEGRRPREAAARLTPIRPREPRRSA